MRVVLVRLSALGDIVHTWPLAVALREANPRIHLSWVVEEPFREIVDGHPAVDAVFTARTKAWRRSPLSASTRAEISILKSQLQELQPDMVIDPQGLLKSAVISRWSGAPRRVGLARPWRRELLAGLAYTDVVRGATRGTHVAATNLEFTRSLGTEPPALSPPDGSWLLAKARALETENCSPESSYAVVLPGTGGIHKNLDETTLAEVCGSLARSGLTVVVAWGPGEIERAGRVVERTGGAARLAPPTTILELSLLLENADLVVGGDTGPVHLAASFGAPTLAVFLASDWRRNGPLGPRTAVVTGVDDVTSSPGGSAKAHPAHQIESAEIVAAARKLLDV